MKVFLTGITGNLGFEVAHKLCEQGVTVIASVRSRSAAEISLAGLPVKLIEVDLTHTLPPHLLDGCDGVVHCAGNTNFTNIEGLNARMIQNVTTAARVHSLPLYYVSTAFLYRPHPNSTLPYNNYERDKQLAEEMLTAALLPYTIFRPSILTGASSTGAIRTRSGYYTIVDVFSRAIALAEANGTSIKFPALPGGSNIIPVDIVANAIVEEILHTPPSGKTLYITNPTPPLANWVLTETLKKIDRHGAVELLNTNFATFASMTKTPSEQLLYQLGLHMEPYWGLSYTFPHGLVSMNYIDSNYLEMILDYQPPA